MTFLLCSFVTFRGKTPAASASIEATAAKHGTARLRVSAPLRELILRSQVPGVRRPGEGCSSFRSLLPAPRHATQPKTNAAFWRKKIAANKARDRKVNRRLRRAGWQVLRVWEHELARKNEPALLRRLKPHVTY